MQKLRVEELRQFAFRDLVLDLADEDIVALVLLQGIYDVVSGPNRDRICNDDVSIGLLREDDDRQPLREALTVFIQAASFLLGSVSFAEYGHSNQWPGLQDACDPMKLLRRQDLESAASPSLILDAIDALLPCQRNCCSRRVHHQLLQ